MSHSRLESLQAAIDSLRLSRPVGRVAEVGQGVLRISGLAGVARIDDRLTLMRRDSRPLEGEVLQLRSDAVVMLPDEEIEGVSLGDRVHLEGRPVFAPSDSWIGRVIDPLGQPLDDAPLLRGPVARELRAPPPDPARRRGFGARLETGMAVLNTMLPVVAGQRVGLFSGSGVGKSSLIAHLARNMEADVVVIALIGERGRELRDFVETVLGPSGMARSVVVAATSDRAAPVRRRCAWAAMAVAEHFRDQGRQVLLLADSITRFAEAHREIAVAGGELPALRGYPPSVAPAIMGLCERAGPGAGAAGDITAFFSVLVPGSDMEEPVADILRGTLDGHVVLDREIAERGRYPAIDLLRSVSRSLPEAASEEENARISEARALLGAHARAETMIRSGLYTSGSDPQLDRAIRAWPELDRFIAEAETLGVETSFSRLAMILRRAGQGEGRPRRERMAARAGSDPSPGEPSVRSTSNAAQGDQRDPR